ncbi:MAG: lysophospholipid acyltransferase family protein [Bacteroidales bacterium]
MRYPTLHFLLSLPVFVLLYTYTAAVVLTILLLSFLGWRRGIVGVMGVWARSVFPMMGKRLRVQGREHIGKGRSYILIANHASLFDITAIMAVCPGVSWFGHERLLKIPLFRQMLLKTDYIPLRLKSVANTRVMLESLEEKARKNSIAIFPEGTRTLDGRINPFYRGFIHVLRASGNDILPVSLTGFFALKPKNRFSINFKSRLWVTIHPPLPGKELARCSDREITDRVLAVLESGMTQTNLQTNESD